MGRLSLASAWWALASAMSWLILGALVALTVGTVDEIHEGLSGNIFRCTGHQLIVDAVREAGAILRGDDPAGATST